MLITIGIPTWNRAIVLKRTLSRIQGLHIPKDVSIEIVVVDNNSTDETQGVLEEFKSICFLKPLFEPKQGRSWALNRAVEVASGDYILWIDDDILVDSNWIVEYHRAFVNFPNAGVFGGRIVPRFEGTPPTWLISALSVIGGVYGMCDPKEGPISIEDPFLPFGGNMAVRRDVQRRFPFDVQLGRQGGRLFAGEESKIIREMLQIGIEGRWVPTAQVEHIVPAHMQTLAHLRRYFHDWGVSMSPKTKRIFGGSFHAGPLWAWRQAFECEFKYRLGKAIGRSPRIWIQDLRLASHAWGVLRNRPMKVPK